MRRKRLFRHLKRLAGDRSGVAFMEFALATPVLMMTTLGGFELVRLALINQQLSSVAVLTADLAARYKDGISEADVNSLFLGSRLSLSIDDFNSNGRIILSSITENEDVDEDGNPVPDGQWIRWQRCVGNGDFESAYGEQGAGQYDDEVPDIDGFTAIDPNTVMIAEVYYDYAPSTPAGRILQPIAAVYEERTLHYNAAFIARELELNTVSNVGTPSLCD
ncbi:hypothetical protein B5C34_12540 [Pacificimonas flava]|uniref:TadE-like domain-containing protein n=2 Tax=Pacificimonas TaxID=1960290 RepID=A0A219B736_9SPHN|nr:MULTISPECIES: TadE/TadG family type IV pilus assembly protein [Pacificimonas]MBZ6378506.1 pilus assembly protein [Pacificimonas aurantium]OWV34202.1 hypothetical protein B5C34_12540 [Pacificimonas flava]